MMTPDQEKKVHAIIDVSAVVLNEIISGVMNDVMEHVDEKAALACHGSLVTALTVRYILICSQIGISLDDSISFIAKQIRKGAEEALRGDTHH